MSAQPSSSRGVRRNMRGGTDPADLARYLAALDDFDKTNNSVPSSSTKATTANNISRLNKQSQHIGRAVQPTSPTEFLDDFQLALKMQEEEFYGQSSNDPPGPRTGFDPQYDATQSFGFTAHHALSPWLKLEREAARDAAMAARLAAEEEEREKVRVLDFEYASQLAQEEDERYNQLIRDIESRNGLLRTSRVINADGTIDGRPGQRAHYKDIENFESWKQLFESTSGFKIRKFHVFVNSELERRFEEAQAELRRRGRPHEEVKAFHGTAEPNIESIRTAGFRIGGLDGHHARHGSSCGVGVYLATSAGTSVGYTGGCNKMFACRVLPGQITPTAQFPPFTLDHPEAYFNHGVYVVRRAELVLPAYMIEW